MTLLGIGVLALLLKAGGPSPESGRPIPTLEGETLNGLRARVTLTGRVTVVDFFATWCPHCRESIGVHEALAREFGSRLQIVVVDVEEPVAIVGSFFAAHPLPKEALLLRDPDGAAMTRFGPRLFPSFYVVDETGTVRSTTRGWGPHSDDNLAAWIRLLLSPPDRRSARKREPRPKPPVSPPGISADEHARRIGVEVVR